MNKFSADKIALLGLLVLTLLFAQALTWSRTGLKMTGPIKPGGVTASVKVPSGNGWKTDGEFNFILNKYVLTSHYMNPVDGYETARLTVQYLPRPERESAQDIFVQKAGGVSGKITKTGQYQVDDSVLDWALIRNQVGEILLFGTSRLHQNRTLNIELREATGDLLFSQKVFQNVAKNVTFEDCQLLDGGVSIIAEIKEKGISSFLENGQSDFFLVKNDKNQNIGFSVDLLKDTELEGLFNINARSYTYVKGQRETETAANYQGDDNFEQFSWEKQTDSVLNVVMILDNSGMLNVREYFPKPKQYSAAASLAAIPDIFLKQVFKKQLEYGYEKIMIDIIESSGTVTPAVISKLEAAENYAYALRLQLLNNRNSFLYVYFDENTDYAKVVQSTGAILEKSTSKNIMKLFPEKASVVENIIEDFEN